MSSDKQAYIAVSRDRYVDGVCLKEAPDARVWAEAQVAAGMTIRTLPASEAKCVAFTWMDEQSARRLNLI